MPRVLPVVDPAAVGVVPGAVAPLAHGPVNLTPVPTTRPTIPRLTVSTRSDAFRRRFYPQAGLRDWNDWRWQNRSRVRTLGDLERMFRLTDDERQAIEMHKGALPVGITPYYASLLDPENPAQGLRRTVVPVLGEYLRSRGEADDPLGEDGHSPLPGLVHRYPDRVLLLVTNFCSVYCRYCTRARMVGAVGERSIRKHDLERAIDYIAANPVIRDVLLSGGDPLSLDDERLEWILGRLRAIPHVEFIRIGSKQPVVQPQRVTPALARILKRYHPLWMSLHFTHPDELTPEVAEACSRLADAGIPLGSQTVLLKGINDDVATMKSLVQGLLQIRVRPYYLYQCDPISGSAHFRTPVEKGIEIIRGLRGHTTGYAVPTFVIDAPEGGGKIPVSPDYIVGRDGDDLLLTNYASGSYRYPDPQPDAAGCESA
ncbi:MAG: KamA family radical SAM protein [Gammaproteobacteria bacterium]